MKKIALLLFFLALAFTINHAYAEEDINVENLPGQLGEHWGISTFAAGLFLSSLLCLSILMGVAMVVKRSMVVLLFVGFSLMGFCIAIGWLPYWIMLLLSLLIASMWASKITKSL